jgi:chaperonin GroEL (HSP60 family)
MGAQMVREVASKTSDIAGDGTTMASWFVPPIVIPIAMVILVVAIAL